MVRPATVQPVRWSFAKAPPIAAVAIAAVLKHPSKPSSLPIILQYRPPIGLLQIIASCFASTDRWLSRSLEAVCVELPAGLVDEGEDCATAAMRELYEETGYGGDAFNGRIHVDLESGTIASDPGMTTANMRVSTSSCLSAATTLEAAKRL